MALHFIVQTGSSEQTFALRDGLLIGRTNADIIVKDPTASSKHATVQRDAQGLWVLVDLDSRNGVNYEGRRVKSLLLKQGVNFSIGKILFKTVDIEDTSASASRSEVEIAPETWYEKISRMAKTVSSSAPKELKNPSIFQNSLRLDFVTGIQAGTRWVISYGPRYFGREIPEFIILEDSAPGVCFSFDAKPNGVVFQTDHPAKVLLNGKPTKTDLIKAGDEIFISQTKIRIDFEI